MVQPRAKTAAMVAARDNRSLSSCMASSCMAAFEVLDILVVIGWRCGVARVCPHWPTNGYLSHRAMRDLCRLEIPKVGRAVSRCGRLGPFIKVKWG